MKKIMLLSLALTDSVSVFSQVRIGIKAGLNLSDMKYEPRDQTAGTPTVNSLYSYHVGAILDVGFAQQFAIQPGIFLTGKGSNVDASSCIYFTHL